MKTMRIAGAGLAHTPCKNANGDMRTFSGAVFIAVSIAVSGHGVVDSAVCRLQLRA